jgi:hypothetical protein
MVRGPIRRAVLKVSKPPVPLIPLIHVTESLKKHPYPVVPLYRAGEGSVGEKFALEMGSFLS